MWSTALVGEILLAVVMSDALWFHMGLDGFAWMEILRWVGIEALLKTRGWQEILILSGYEKGEKGEGTWSGGI